MEKTKKQKIKEFVEFWKDKGYEKGQSQTFWLMLLRDILDIEEPEKYIRFEDKVALDKSNGFIDARIPKTKVMIEQKSIQKDLNNGIKQSDGSLLNPYQQAKRYIAELPLSQHPRWVITCNFKEFYIYDMEKPKEEPEIIKLKDLEKEYYRLEFIKSEENIHIQKEMEISIKAGEIIGKIYEEFLKQYENPENIESLKSLNKLCVRLVFCLYAEDSGIFKKDQFYDYLEKYDPEDMRAELIRLFKILDTKYEDRDVYLKKSLNEFPYVNGGLFKDEDIEIPQITEELKKLILTDASKNFDWSKISPTIFGAVFESTLNPETRRSGGMHYTSIENIHKVIDPLFLNQLEEEYENIKKLKTPKIKSANLFEFQKKLGNLKFLDPAAGSGNFLTETYLSLRRLENKVIKEIMQIHEETEGQIGFAITNIQVSINQFYGIEINDFAVTVAQCALWIAESQMLKETNEILHTNIDLLPLKTAANIVEENALEYDWEQLVKKEELNYIMGNPPFVGFTFMTKNQKENMSKIFPNVKNLDFVCAWYKKASDYIENTNIECGFVSTNSITQGETVARLWEFLDITINFAHRTFIWDSEASIKAHVHCVIIGFSKFNRKNKFIYDSNLKLKAENINPYLMDAPNVLVKSRNTPLCNVSKMVYGNKPADGGNLIIENSEYDDFIKKEPETQKYIRPLLGAAEYLHRKKRYCLWLKNANPSDIKKSKQIMERIKLCQESRNNSKAAGIRKFALTPSLFAQITQPEKEDYILIPRVSSEKRKYIPMGFINSNTIVTDAVQIVPSASIYEFGILISNVHMAWMRAIAGRLKSDYRYSKDVVYNNFIWPNPDKKQKEKIEKTAQAILDARELYPDSSLADLYDILTMPSELLNAHQQNDIAVMEAYGFDWRNMTESDCVSELMRLYSKKISEK